MIEKPDKLSEKEFYNLYKEIADDVISVDGWEYGDILFISGCVTLIIMIWELLTNLVWKIL